MQIRMVIFIALFSCGAQCVPVHAPLDVSGININQAPQVNDGKLTILEDTPGSGILTSNAEPISLITRTMSQGTKGVAAFIDSIEYVENSTYGIEIYTAYTYGSLAYTPLSNTSGTAIVTVTVTDDGLDGSGNGDVGSVQKTFTVTVN